MADIKVIVSSASVTTVEVPSLVAAPSVIYSGAPGLTGATGSSATISIGTVTSTYAGNPAAVQNVGTSTAAVLNFTIPRGFDGDAGSNGQDGQGGTPGSDGASAYQVAVSNGFTGSEAEWLQSLIGPQGDPGVAFSISETKDVAYVINFVNDGNLDAPYLDKHWRISGSNKTAIYQNEDQTSSIYYTTSNSRWNIERESRNWVATNDSGNTPTASNFFEAAYDGNGTYIGDTSFSLVKETKPRNQPEPLGTASGGVSLYAARADHVHAYPTPTQIGAASLVSGKVPSSQLPSYATVATSGSASDLGTGTLPDARLSTNVVTLTGTQTLTNKSISSGQITGLGTAATKDIPPSGNASSTQVVYGSDTRLTNSRTPSSTLAHASSHASGGSDALTLAALQITGLASVATSGSASDLSTGTLPDARLSSNIATIQAKVSTAQADSTTSASFTDVTGLSGFTLAANTTYVFEFTGRMTIPGSSSFQVLLNSSAALANPSMSGWSIGTGTRSDNAFGVSTGTTYYFLQKAGSATNNPSSAFYYVVTGSTAPTIKVQFSQQNTTVGTANLLVGAVASFRKLA
jgi:hypothetical protein